MFTIGFVLSAHGVRGLLRVRTETDLSDVPTLYLDGKSYTVKNVTPDKRDFLVELVGLTDRTAAEKLKGAQVATDRESLPELDENELRVGELIGCKVYDVAGALLGEVVTTFYSGAHELLEVKGPTTFLLPFVDGMVVSVDLAGKRIVCDPPEGLTDLAAVEK